MKTKYTKPTIAFQNIALSSGLSSSCAFQANFQFGSCEVMIPEWGETVYNDGQCDIGFEDFPCYHVPAASSNIFES